MMASSEVKTVCWGGDWISRGPRVKNSKTRDPVGSLGLD